MDCESCDALLIDLVERELDETRAAEVRAHASGCDACGRALARLESGRRAASELVRMEPPRLDAVMAAARARAAEVRAAAAAAATSRESSEPAASSPSPKVSESEESWLARALHWLGAWAARPQVAMAALLLLMVGIGLYNLPAFRSREGADADGALVEPDVRAELGPSALAPAEPLQLDVDPRTQRVALGTGEAIDDAVEPTHDERPTTTLAQTDTPNEEARARIAEEEVHEAAPTPSEEPATETAVAVAEIAPSESVGRVEDGPLPDVAAGPEQPAVVLAPAPPPVVAPSAPTVAPHPPSVAAGRAPAPSAPSYDEVERPSTSAAAIMPAAIHRQARALAATGHCDEAVPRYRALLTDHPDYADAPHAMIELADCDRRLGRLDEADRWLARAESFPSVSAEARRQRTVVSAERRAVDHAASAGASTSADVRATTPSSMPASQ